MNTNLHILLVDDDEDDRMFFQEALNDLKLNISFEYSVNGVEALQRLSNSDKRFPDIVFLDLNMPLLSGKECLEQIRGNDLLKSLKVIIYSTSFDPITVDALHQIGANHYIRKPGAYEDLKMVIFTGIKSLERKAESSGSIKDFVLNP